MKTRWYPVKRAARRDFLAFGEVQRQLANRQVGKLVRIIGCCHPQHPWHPYPPLDCPVRAKGLVLMVEAVKLEGGVRYLVHVEGHELWLREGEFTEAG